MYSYTFGYISEADGEPSVPHLVFVLTLSSLLPPDPPVSK
jgi:hypothetical protein